MSNLQLDTYTYDDDSFSDIYKEVNNFRPRNHEYWSASPDRKQAIWEDLLKDLDYVNSDYEREQAKSLSDFERRISECIKYGAPDRETAIRWIVDGEEIDYISSAHELVWHFNLPENMVSLFSFNFEGR